MRMEGELGPAGAFDATGRRVAFMPAAVLGNGSLLVTLSARGEVERLFWPHVDGPQHLGELRLGLCPNGRTHWLDEEPFSWEQRYDEDASILRTVARDGEHTVEIVDAVHPHDPVLVRRIHSDGEGRRIVALCCPMLEEAHFYGAAYVDPGTGALVFYRRHVAVAIALSCADERAVGRTRRGHHYSVLDDACDGRLDGDAVAHRQPLEGALAGDLRGDATLLVAFAADAAAALALVREHGRAAPGAAETARRRHDAGRLAAARPASPGPEGLDALYRRSLLVLEDLTDRATGATVAAPEMDPRFLRSGGYGFVWPRDLAYISLALLAAGKADLVAPSLRWLSRHQAPEGLWLQRHWTDGALAPAWSMHQLDETGAALFAYEAAWRELEDESLDAELWPSMRRGADFLTRFVDGETGLPLASVDLWEQHDGQHTYTAAATVAGLRAGAAMAARHEPALRRRYAAAAASIACALDAHLWSEEHGRFLRSRNVGRSDAAGLPPGCAFARNLPYPNRTIRSVDPRDTRLDSSLLGLAWPFVSLDLSSQRLRATVDAVASGLAAPCGGTYRHEDDTYAGGNPWLISTLWLGLARRLLGDEVGHRGALEYVLSRRTGLDLLPEQVLPDGRPAWVLPLAWSHAMLLLAARPELTIVRDLADATAAARSSA
nr:glycoside hydrolase family 15 protein [Gaiella occulta]